jgi:hypothetical protein
MNTSLSSTDVVQVQAHYSTNRQLGHWTTGRRFAVRAVRGQVVLDLRSPRIPPGDLEVEILADHAMIKLLVPEDALVDHWSLEFAGRGRVKDGPVQQTEGATRTITLTGRLQHAEVRIRRGGVAVLAAMLTREYVSDVRQAHRDGTIPTVADPANTAPNTPYHK